MRTKILTDTTCDLSKERREALDITALPLHVMLGGVDHLDGVDVTQEQLFAYAQENKQLPKTAAISVAEFQAAFVEAFEAGYDEVVYTGLSSKLSSTFQNALLARDGLGEAGYDPARVHIVDSKQLSSGTAHLLLRGAEILRQGGSAQEVEEDMLRTVPKLSTHFVVDTLQYLHMGGRCSSIAYLAGSVLKLHPQINMVDGRDDRGRKVPRQARPLHPALQAARGDRPARPHRAGPHLRHPHPDAGARRAPGGGDPRAPLL